MTIINMPIKTEMKAAPSLASKNCVRVGPRVKSRRTVPMLYSPPTIVPIRMIIKTIQGVRANCTATFNEMGKRKGVDTLSRASCRSCSNWAGEGVGQFVGWPGPGLPFAGVAAGFDSAWHGGAKLSAGAFCIKKVPIEINRNRIIANAAAMLPKTLDILRRRSLYSSIPIKRSITDR